jgi:protein-tyrosine phosphatase
MVARAGIGRVQRDRSTPPTGKALIHLRNLRDVGGLLTRDGLVVGSSRLYRSSSPSLFTATEQQALASLALRTAIDLRTATENSPSEPSGFPEGVRVLNLPLFEAPRDNWLSPSDQEPQATAERYFEMLDDGLQTLAATVHAVAAPNATPVLVSCTAGRDRTGIVVACLLDLLGVTDEAIAADYARSDSFDPAGGRAHAATVHELLALIRRRFGTTQHMLAPHGITLQTIETLRRALLAPAPSGTCDEHARGVRLLLDPFD